MVMCEGGYCRASQMENPLHDIVTCHSPLLKRVRTRGQRQLWVINTIPNIQARRFTQRSDGNAWYQSVIVMPPSFHERRTNRCSVSQPSAPRVLHWLIEAVQRQSASTSLRLSAPAPFA